MRANLRKRRNSKDARLDRLELACIFKYSEHPTTRRATARMLSPGARCLAVILPFHRSELSEADSSVTGQRRAET